MSKLYTATFTCEHVHRVVLFKSDAKTLEGLRLSAFKALIDRDPGQRALTVAVLQMSSVEIKEVSLV